MRALAAAAILAFGVAGVTAAAADLRMGGARSRSHVTYGVIGVRAAPVIIYGYEPGVVMRAYWLPPWRHRHYFPSGRDRVRGRAVGRPRPARTQRRHLSNSRASADAMPRAAVRSLHVPLPRAAVRSVPVPLPPAAVRPLDAAPRKINPIP